MTEPFFADTDAAGSRYYVLNTGERFISVTTVLSYIAKPHLTGWAARLAAEAALDNAERVFIAADTPSCNTKGDNACGLCRDCVTTWLADRHNVYRDAAGDRGSKLHEAAEHREKFGPGGTVDDDAKPFFDAYVDWADRAQPEIIAAEMTVVSRKWGHAGTLDNLMRFGDDSVLPKTLEHLRHKVLLVDKKTSKSIDRTHAWQINGYSLCETAVLEDGSEIPTPAVDSGLILHIRPEAEGGVKMREAHINPLNQAKFIHTLRMAEGVTAPLGDVLSRPAQLPKTKETTK
ncbi:hypothetical protein [Glycomyces sp. NPDC021274]|uniref:hypothetical protein n=1 Tax=Glycomyces sp. NPDC021274 TaxID=3155120 RepID=UPI0033DD08AC